MRLTRLAANAAIAGAYAADHHRLLALASDRPLLRRAQESVLRRVLARNVECEFGRVHRFGHLRSPADFAAAVPISTWDDYAEPADRIAAGAQGVLTAERVRLLEPSSGSTAATKLVPYTDGLKSEFGRGIRPWLHDLYRSYPRLLAGRAYWSITPAASRPVTPSTVPSGFDEDADYLGPLAKRLMGAVFAVPGDVARAATMDAFRAQTALALLAADDLALVSVWNPTFFTGLLDWTTVHASDLLLHLPLRRRTAVGSAIKDGDWASVWPRLAVVSAWADAQAASAASELAAVLPQARLQPKGLLATEAIVSVPIERAAGAVLAARSHYVEFLPEGSTDAVGAHEVEIGGQYGVVVTTSGGLYRYRLGDLVEVTGRLGALPVLRFLGRTDHVSDLVGEKLSEAFVASALAVAGASGFAVLTPLGRRGYALVTDAPDADLADRLDAALRANFHYDYARRLGQLDGVRVLRAAPGAAGRYADARVAAGQRLGDVKVPALDPTGLVLALAQSGDAFVADYDPCRSSVRWVTSPARPWTRS